MQVVASVGYCGCSVELSWQSDYQPIPHLTVVEGLLQNAIVVKLLQQ